MIEILRKYLEQLSKTAHTEDDRRLAKEGLEEARNKPLRIVKKSR
tara:strand:+ start:156 stop:290 length:135 start_codon:yes stop_codon:yes gene_type:complete